MVVQLINPYKKMDPIIHISDKFKKSLKDDLFINIGANIGTISRSLCIFCTIIAIEADLDTLFI